jgi:hypothetical protein
MRYVITIIKKIISKEAPKPVGRWRVEQCNKQMNSKIDLSNEDHCGPCGQYALTKMSSPKSESVGQHHDEVLPLKKTPLSLQTPPLSPAPKPLP